MSSLESVGEGQIHPLNFLESGKLVPAGSVDLMVTSPPYMNNYHYVRNTRPQLFWLSLVSSPGQLKDLEEANFGKYWQTVRDRDPVGLAFDSSELVRVLADLRRTRKEKGSYGGPGWANYVASYFNDCYRFFQTLKRIMARDGIGVIVIGNSIIQGHEIRTDLVLADLAQQIGFELEGIQIIRTKRVGSSITGSTVRRGRKTAASLYESAVIIRKK
jgi:DNA modification methylase